ncbi:unnamed protein product [Closterium sp. NIES-65]|nr:unnamed protein product [Closterium sp. NIES-65]CAI5998591.1 unnamed protein product [Closterium sp. NIES-65]
MRSRAVIHIERLWARVARARPWVPDRAAHPSCTSAIVTSFASRSLHAPELSRSLLTSPAATAEARAATPRAPIAAAVRRGAFPLAVDAVATLPESACAFPSPSTASALPGESGSPTASAPPAVYSPCAAVGLRAPWTLPPAGFPRIAASACATLAGSGAAVDDGRRTVADAVFLPLSHHALATFVPPFPISPRPLYSLIVYNHTEAAVVALLLAGASDWLDGYLARRFKGGESVLGSYLDPLADKALVACVALALLGKGLLPPWLAVLVLARDVFLFGGHVVMRLNAVQWKWWQHRAHFFNIQKGTAERVEPLLISKVNTCLQMLLLPAALLHDPYLLSTAPNLLPYLWYLSLLSSLILFSFPPPLPPSSLPDSPSSCSCTIPFVHSYF